MHLFNFKKQSRDMAGFLQAGRKKQLISAIPQSNSLQIQRTKQIESMRLNLSNLEEISKDSEYQASFNSNGKQYTLYIHLPSSFPNDPPLVQIRPLLVHPWIDHVTCKIVGYDSLSNFKMHDNLGKTVASLVREFTSYRVHTQEIYSSSPVHINSIQRYTPLPHMGSPNLQMPHRGSPDLQTAPRLCYPNSPPMKDVKTIGQAPVAPSMTGNEFQQENAITPSRDVKWIKYDVIDQLTVEEMNKMLSTSDETVWLSFIDFEGLQLEAENERIRLLTENVKLADENLEFKPKMDELNSILAEKKSQETALLNDFRNYSDEQAKVGEFSEFKIIQNLTKISEQADQEAEKFAEDFVKGSLKLDCKSFVDEFLKKKQKIYIRNTKINKMFKFLSDEKNILSFKSCN